MAAFGAKAMRNTSGGAYRALGDEKKTWSDARWQEAFAADPMLIKRPIVEKDGVPVAVGFREDRYRELREQFGDSFIAGMGAESVKELLLRLDLDLLAVDPIAVSKIYERHPAACVQP